MGIINKFKKFMGLMDNDDYTHDGIVKPSDISKPVKDFSYDMIADPEVYGNLESSKTFLLMDDQPEVFFLYDTDFKNIKKKYGLDILADFKIVKCAGPDAGFMAHKYMKVNTDELLVAILDITLGKYIKTDAGIILFDGVDIALEIYEKHPACSVKFCSGHLINRSVNSGILDFVVKFEKATNLDINDYYFSKNSNRVDHIHDMLLNTINVAGKL